jgi:hypothetical protein
MEEAPENGKELSQSAHANGIEQNRIATKSLSFKFRFWGFVGGCRLAAPFLGNNPAETNIKQIIFK